MKEICGYLGKDDKFYKTEEECERADLEYSISKTKNILNHFSGDLQRYIFNVESDIFGTGGRMIMEYEMIKSRLLDTICEKILLDSDKFIEVINRKKELENELDRLQELYEKKNNVSKPWWLKLKWWKKR